MGAVSVGTVAAEWRHTPSGFAIGVLCSLSSKDSLFAVLLCM